MDADGHWQGLSRLERASAGVLEEWLPQIVSRQPVQCPAIVVRRDVYESVGGFREDLCFALDWEMWVRIARRHRFWYEPEPLAVYRRHPANESSRLERSGANVVDMYRAASIVAASLDPSLHRAARRHATRYALETSARLWAGGQGAAAWLGVRAALQADPSPWLALQLLRGAWLALASRRAHAAQGR